MIDIQKINELIGVDESFKASDKLYKLLMSDSYIQLEQLLYKYRQLGGILVSCLNQDISTQRTLLLSHKLE